jgi:PTH1 family peptidyl-tRNA hydrolase
MKLLVGLGNPGAQYETTRHNVGWMALDRLAAEHRLTFKTDRRFRADVAEVAMPETGGKVILAKPLTYMNLSGESVGALARFYKVSPEDIAVVYDEMALPLGEVRVRPGGSSAGHNGIKSLIAHLGTQEFPRVRIGVGAPVGGAIGHVLGTFRKEEWPAVHDAITLAVAAAITVLRDGVEAAMNRYNGKAKTSGA